MIDRNAKWIWINDSPKSNEYAFFEGSFCFSGEKALFSVAAETDYVLTVNGRLAGFGQFAGYPFEKYCDEIDISELCHYGDNSFLLTVRYEGCDSATHIDTGAGAIFSLDMNGRACVISSSDTVGGYDGRYIQHTARYITPQLGLSSGMRSGNKRTYAKCVELNKCNKILPRPVLKTALLPPLLARQIKPGSGIYDLGREDAGYLTLRVKASVTTRFKIAYGEHLADGAVRYMIGGREFSLDFEVDGGECEFVQLFVRVAARYLEIIDGDGVEVMSIGLIPARYPLTEKKIPVHGISKKIYDTCLHTLRLCMNAHYEDCPWREQALYVMDSRNQMLSGYYAFEGQDFQRANLIFISKGVRSDGFLELTYPAVNTPAIPMFSLMYPVAVYEYVEHTGDMSILGETMPVMRRIMEQMRARLNFDGLISELDKPFWNFYEWSKGNDGTEVGTSAYHLILNCAWVYSCTRFCRLAEMFGEGFDADIKKTKRAICKFFFNNDEGLFATRPGERHFSALGNAMAVLCGLGDRRTIDALRGDDRLVPATLSMQPFVYDALLLSGADNRDYIIEDIEKKYCYMLSLGATTFWETIEGERAFDNAGSLCHGWSAMPIYYYNILSDNRD